MFHTLKSSMLVSAALAIFLAGYAPNAAAQSTATVQGRVQDAQGAVVPNAPVTLTSETRGTIFTATSTSTGDYIFSSIPGDTYKVSVAVSGFKKAERTGILATTGDTVAIPPITLEIGAVSETIDVSSEAPLVQAASGERSKVIETEIIQNVPIAGTNFANQVALTPGVNSTTSANPSRSDNTGNVARTNYQLDGVNTNDTGGNQQGVALNYDSISEVHVLTYAYQAEYGRASGLQVIGITKSGTDQLHGSLHDYDQHSGWNSNSWANEANGLSKPYTLQRYWGGTLGGPVGKPGKGQHKLFWFISEETQPAANGGSVAFFRVPTALERQGNFSQTTDQNGALFNTITDTTTGKPCSATNTAGCFGSGGVLGVIPPSQLYATGLALLNQYPMPNVNGLNYNLQEIKPRFTVTTFQQVERGDWNVNQKLRISGKYAGQNLTNQFSYGTIPGFNDTVVDYPARMSPSVTAVYTLSPTLIFEGTFGYTRGNEEAGPAVPADKGANKCLVAGSALCNFPELFPNALKIPAGSFAQTALAGKSFFQNGYALLLPQNTWSGRVSNAPPNIAFPGFLCWQYSLDTNLSLTKIWGKHTLKAGFQQQLSIKYQNLGSQGTGVIPNEGTINFGNNSNNPLDTGFPFANAAMGVFQSYAQQTAFIEGRYVYHNNDFYIQDNYKATRKLTIDAGLRFVHNGPQYDSKEQLANFFPDQWQASQAPQLFQPGCAVPNQNPCSAANKVAVNPVNNSSLGLGSSSIIGAIVPNTGNLLNGIQVAGKGINKANYSEPFLVFGPRIGAAYSLNQKIVFRGAFGLLYDRPQGDAVFYQTGNPPFDSQATVYNSTLQAVAAGTASAYAPPSQMLVFNYKADIPASFQFNFGSQIVLPWASLLDVSYVQSYNYNTVGWGTISTPGGYTPLDLNAPDLGAAYLAKNQDPTLGTSAVPGATAYTTNLLRPYRGLGAIYDTSPSYRDLYSSIQIAYTRRYSHGITAGFNETLGLRNTGNFIQQPILQHIATSNGYSESLSPTYLSNQSVINNVGFRRHTLKGYVVYEIPQVKNLPSFADAIVNGYQLSMTYSGGSGAPYDVTYSYQSNGANVNLTGSPNYVARVNIGSNPGSGCSGNSYAEINTAAFSGPTYNSVGNESGSAQFNYCFFNIYDMALQRSFKVFGEKRKLSLRFDAFNVFNTAVISGISTSMTLPGPAAPSTITNNQFLSSGALNTARIIPQNAGFGAANAALAKRSLQATIRFTF